MPTSTPLESTTGKRSAVVFAENIQRFLLRIGHVQRHESFVANLAHLRRERPEQKLAHAHVIDQLSAVIDDINQSLVSRCPARIRARNRARRCTVQSSLTAIKSGVIKRPTLPSG